MSIRTKLPDLTPASERLKREIDLISGGYSVAPDVVNGKLTVYPWDSEVSEWIISRKAGGTDADFTAQVLMKVTRLPERVVNNFVANEALLVMLVARSLVSNGQLHYTAKCPHCGTVQRPSSIKVPDQLDVIGKKEQGYVGWDMLTLPESGDILKVRPLLVADTRRAAELAGTDKGLGLSETAISTASSIAFVNDSTPDNAKELLSYYRALHPRDVDAIHKHLRENSPSLSTLIPHVCDSEQCQKPFSFNLGLNYDFFLPSL